MVIIFVLFNIYRVGQKLGIL